MTDETTDVGATAEAPAEKDPFEGCEVIPGYEELGRVIRDSAGNLSGSPANYEATRGVTSEAVAGTPLSKDEETELLSWLKTQVPSAI